MIRRIHALAGLLALGPLLVFGLVGIFGAIGTARMAPAVEQSAAFEPRAGESDRQTAERAIGVLGLTLATPVQQAAIQHDGSGRLVLDFYHANGRHRVTVLPAERRLRIEVMRATLPRYLDILHMTTAAFRTGDWRMRAWSWVNEGALWCLFLLLGSGAWMSVRHRKWRSRTVRGTHHLTGLVVLPVAALYAVSALEMAHHTWIGSGGAMAWLGRLHRTSGAFAAALGLGVFAVAATGLLLWWTARRNGLEAAVSIGAFVAVLALVAAMRAG